MDTPTPAQRKRKNKLKSGCCIGCGTIFILFMFLFSLQIAAEPVRRENARGLCCLSHLRLIVDAVHVYIAEHGSPPPLYTTDENGKPLHSWRVLLLPYFEKLPNYCQDNGDIRPSELYRQIRQDEPWNSEYNQTFHEKAAYFYRCPSGQSYIYPDYKNCQYLRIDSGSGWAVVDAGHMFCWMDPYADKPFDDLLENAEEMKNKDIHDENVKRLYFRHWTVSWWWKIPIVNIIGSDGNAVQIRERNLAEELKKWKERRKRPSLS